MARTTPTISIDAVEREPSKHGVATLRRNGYIPGVLYGYNLEPCHVAVTITDLEKTWKKAGKTHLVAVNLGERTHNVLIRDLQIDPRYGKVFHVDLFAINPKTKLTADVPIIVHGDAPAVSVTKVGQLLQLITTIKVECLPSDLPSQFNVVVDGLTDLDMSITVEELEVPHGVTILHSPMNDIVVKIGANRVQVEEEEEESKEITEETAEAPAESEGE